MITGGKIRVRINGDQLGRGHGGSKRKTTTRRSEGTDSESAVASTRGRRLQMRYLQSYETGKMEGIFKSISIEWVGKVGPTYPNLMTTSSEPCNGVGNPSKD